MPNYNHARFIPDALGAILSQSYRPKEILIVDDGSTDNSIEILEQQRRRAPDLIKLYRHERNLGLTKTLAELTTMASGDYMFAPAFDDRVLPGFFERSMALLTRHPNAGVCSTLSRVMSETGLDQGLVTMPVVTPRDAYLPPEEARRTLRRHGNWFMGNTTVFRRRSLLSVGGYRSELGPYCDGFASLAIALSDGACFIPSPLAVWRRMDSTFSSVANSDIDAVLKMLRQTEYIMRTEFAELFPEDAIHEWRRDLHFGIASSHARCGPVGFANARRLVPATTPTDHAFDLLIRSWPGIGQRLAKPYFFSKLKRRHTWTMIRRRLTHWTIRVGEWRRQFE